MGVHRFHLGIHAVEERVVLFGVVMHNGEMVDVPFAWAWISLEAGYPAKAAPADARVLEALEDAAYGDLGGYFSER